MEGIAISLGTVWPKQKWQYVNSEPRLQDALYDSVLIFYQISLGLFS